MRTQTKKNHSSRFHKKGQAAMEFLMTYGWAILVVLIAVAALYALGIFDSGGGTTCKLGAPFTCDLVVSAGPSADSLLVTSQGVSGGTITITPDASGGCAGGPTALVSGETTIPLASCASLVKGTKLKGTIKIVDYKIAGSNLPKTISGTWSTTVTD